MKKSPDNAKRDSLSLQQQQQQLSVVLLTKLIYQFATRTDEHESFLCVLPGFKGLSRVGFGGDEKSHPPPRHP